MGLASAIHHAVQARLSFNHVSSKSSPIKRFRIHFTHSRLPAFCSVTLSRRGQCYPVACTSGTQQEDDLSTSEIGKTSSAERNDEVDGVSVDKADGHGAYTSSLKTVALCVGVAVAFGVGVGLKDGVGKASEFFAGYILEQSLSVDNLFVFVLVFKYFKVPLMYQNRVLTYGIIGAIIFRSSLILLGTATLQRFEAVNLFLAAILLYSSFKLFASEESDDDNLSNNFIVKTCQKFIPVTSSYHGDRFITRHDGVWKASTILGRPHLYFLQWQLLSSVT